MKKRIHIIPNEIIGTEYRNIFSINDLTKTNSNNFKKEEIEQILISHKSSLVVLFDTIKNFQNDYFSKINKINNIKLLKNLLNILQNNLTEMQNKKMEKFNSFKIKIQANKKRIQENLFTEKEDNINYNDDIYSSYIKQKKELNFINFQIQNEITKTKIMTDIKKKIYLYFKNIPFYLNLIREIYCDINQEDSQTVSEILKNIRSSTQNIFISLVKEKIDLELEIKEVKLKIKFMEDNMTKDKSEGNKRFIEPEKIIYEETKENENTLITNQNKRNNDVSINKISFNKNKLKKSSDNLSKKLLSIDSKMDDNSYRNKLFDLFIKNKDIIDNNKNKINNFFNINVNINLGCNKHNPSISSPKNKDNYESKDDEVKIEPGDDNNNSIIESTN